MKKIIMVTVAVFMLTGIFGCGDEKTIANTESSGEQVEEQQYVGESAKEELEEERVKTDRIEGGLLAGVYSDGDELVEIPMGTYFEGGQKVFCNVKIASNYRSAAFYDLDGESNDKGFEQTDGGTTLAFSIEEGLLEEDYAIKEIIIMAIKDNMTFSIVPTAVRSMEDVKTYASEVFEIGTQEVPAFYYVDPSEYSISDVDVYILLNEDMGMLIKYEGPLAEELGLDQLARNIYDLVTVVE